MACADVSRILPRCPKAERQTKFNEVRLLEASPGIEPGYKDLQSSASPLRHEASRGRIIEPWQPFRTILEKSQEGSF